MIVERRDSSSIHSCSRGTGGPIVAPAEPAPIASGEPEGDALAAAREQMDSLLAASDSAINAALSQDSAAFLSATTQRGGQ